MILGLYTCLSIVLSIILLSLSLNGLPLDCEGLRPNRGDIARAIGGLIPKGNRPRDQTLQGNNIEINRILTIYPELSYTWGNRIPTIYPYD